VTLGRSGKKRARIPPNAVGHIDVYQVMKAFIEAGYGNTMTLDHMPRFAEGYEAARTGYAIGYMRALLQVLGARREMAEG